MDVNVFLYVSCVCSLLIQKSDQCILTNNGLSLPSFVDYGGSVGRINRYHQAIIPSYRFTCCGEIRGWGADVRPGGGKEDREYTLNFQVWRPSPTVGQMGGGVYSLVGNNRFTSIDLDGDVAESLLPSPSDYIQFQPGDVLGFYVEDARDDNNKGVAVLTTTSYTRESVWYASTSQTVAGCPISVGSAEDLNTMLTGAPVISISTETSNCPQMLPTPPPCPFTPPPTTAMVTEAESTTAQSTTEEPTTPEQTTEEPTTPVQTTKEPTTPEQTTEEPTTPEPTTEEPTTSAETPPDPTTEEPISSDSIATDMASSTTNMVPDSSTSDDDTPSTDSTPDEAVNDRVGGGGTPASVIAAVVLAILVVITLMSVLIAVIVSKKKNRANVNQNLGITNQLQTVGGNSDAIEAEQNEAYRPEH